PAAHQLGAVAGRDPCVKAGIPIFRAVGYLDLAWHDRLRVGGSSCSWAGSVDVVGRPIPRGHGARYVRRAADAVGIDRAGFSAIHPVARVIVVRTGALVVLATAEGLRPALVELPPRGVQPETVLLPGLLPEWVRHVLHLCPLWFQEYEGGARGPAPPTHASYATAPSASRSSTWRPR